MAVSRTLALLLYYLWISCGNGGRGIPIAPQPIDLTSGQIATARKYTRMYTHKAPKSPARFEWFLAGLVKTLLTS